MFKEGLYRCVVNRDRVKLRFDVLPRYIANVFYGT